MVQAETKGKIAEASQWYIIPGQINPLEPVVLFKNTEGVRLFFAVREIRVDEIGNSAFDAGANSVGDQRIRGSFVPVLYHRENMHQSRLSPRFINRQLDETDQTVFKKRSNENAAVEKRPGIFTRSFGSNSVVGESPSLPNGVSL